MSEYNVREESKPLLEAIFQTYGDIGANCSLSNFAAGLYLLKSVCEVVQTLQETDFLQLNVEKITYLIDVVKELQTVNIAVKWLHERLSNILEAKQIVKQSSSMKQDKDKNNEEINETVKQLEEYEKEMVLVDHHLHSLKENINLIKEKLAAAKNDVSRIKEAHSVAKGKVKMLLR